MQHINPIASVRGQAKCVSFRRQTCLCVGFSKEQCATIRTHTSLCYKSPYTQLSMKVYREEEVQLHAFFGKHARDRLHAPNEEEHHPGGSQGHSERNGEKRSVRSEPVIETRFFGCPSSQISLPHNYCQEAEITKPFSIRFSVALYYLACCNITASLYESS